AYKGRALASGEKCYWKVRVWDNDDNPSPYSDMATFEMGLLKGSDWRGKWIGAKEGISSPLLRKEFKLGKEIKRARVYISGLGYYELYINGKKVGDHVLDPGTTYYNNDQPFELHSRVLNWSKCSGRYAGKWLV
ncbi:MAG: alpha-L-rhamnosidase N-terminal domain-containing protein, partial [Deltaproteobacteria bacterium]|nr:alpha-L-rhamnosidase N-terminal domain-containing protein [Deltaproteobacteria bacterium]